MFDEGFEKRLRDDRAVAAFARGGDVTFALEGDAWRTTVAIRTGSVSLLDGAEASFVVRMPDTTWRLLLAAHPSPGYQSALGLVRSGQAEVDGDEFAFAQNLQLLRAVVEVARGSAVPASPSPHRPLTMRGEYLRVPVEPWGSCDVFVERAGSGIPLVCLATAGSDSRQYHGLVTETDLTDRYEIIAFDLPWHGKSDPAWGRHPLDYTLDSDGYLATIAGVVEALGLDDLPVLVGSSMAGAAVVEAIARRPEIARGAVAAQAGPRVSGRRTPWLRSAEVNQTLHVPEWTYGLMSPESPAELRDRVWWGYSQGGYGAYDADIGYYTSSWDIDRVRDLLTPSSPPIVVMSGAFDTSVPPAASEELAGLIPNSSFRLMPELGHFPHAENPAAFAPHLEWALDRILNHPHREDQAP